MQEQLQDYQVVSARIYKLNRNENFCKGTKLAKLLRRLKLTIKKVHWFLSRVCNGKFAVFWVLCYGITCKWPLFPSIDVYFCWLALIIGKYNRLATACIVKTAIEA